MFYSIVTSGIIDILGATIEKNTWFRGSHKYIIASKASALLLPG